MAGKKIDITGSKFNMLTVIEFIPNNKAASYWKCRCDCGAEKIIRGSSLKNGNTKSCGCASIELITKHGYCKNNKPKTNTYYIWTSIKQRCYNKKMKRYKSYGGRGIKVCDRWLNSFSNFLSDMGEKPSNLSLDRIDNDQGYSPENCRWATKREQANNTRTNNIIQYKNQKFTLTEFARHIGIHPETLRKRIRMGWDLDKCANTKPDKRKATKTKNVQSIAGSK